MNMIVSLATIKKIVETDLNIILQTTNVQIIDFERKTLLQNQDDTMKFLVKDSENNNIAFILCSYSEFGVIPLRNMNKSNELKTNLTKQSGSVLLTPILEGEVEGVCYVVWPYCEPLKSSFIAKQIQLLNVKPTVLNWLRDVTEESLCKLEEIDVAEHFAGPLKRFGARDDLDARVKDTINMQVQSLEEGQWLPHFVLAHNDLWIGNVLINKHNGVTIIDWASAHYKSFAIYDLVRLSMSLKLSKRVFHRELQAHCQILQCETKDSMGYLLASLAFLSENLDHFSEDRFLMLVKKCFDYLECRL